MVRTLCAAAFAALTFVPAADAADGNGDFAIRGAGRLTCEQLGAALAARDATQLTIFATWVEGYITAANQFQDATFDATPWQTTELILALSGQACAERGQETTFMDIIGRLIAEMRPIRLAEKSGLVRIGDENAVQVHYRETVERVRARLIALGYEFEQPSIIGEKAMDEMSANLRAYQAKEKLPQSGRLDQHTLLNLFVRPSK